MDILNAGKVELVDSMGDDQSVVQAARISNGAVMPDWRGAPDERLIRFLADHGHMTPFEHATFKFYVKAPIFVIREWQRHRTFSYNELSARYKKLNPEFFVPEIARVPDPDNKQSSIEAGGSHLNGVMKDAFRRAYDRAWEEYTVMINMGIAREIARSVLPVGIYSEMYVTGNFRNWMHFLQLRMAPEAQLEIRKYADAIGGILAENMPNSYLAISRNWGGN